MQVALLGQVPAWILLVGQWESGKTIVLGTEYIIRFLTPVFRAISSASSAFAQTGKNATDRTIAVLMIRVIVDVHQANNWSKRSLTSVYSDLSEIPQSPDEDLN